MCHSTMSDRVGPRVDYACNWPLAFANPPYRQEKAVERGTRELPAVLLYLRGAQWGCCRTFDKLE
jgi:hypothetical protein